MAESARQLRDNPVWQEITDGELRALERRMDSLPLGDPARVPVADGMTLVRRIAAQVEAYAQAENVERFNALRLAQARGVTNGE